MILRALSVTAFVLAGQFAVAQSTVSAVLEPVQTAEMRATVSGRLDLLTITEGQDVKAGEVLAQMDSRVQKARLALAKLSAESTGEIARADALIAQAQGLVDRVEQAKSRGAAQSWEVDQARRALDVARADKAIIVEARDRAIAQLNLEQAILSEFDIRAPFDGRILQIHREAGETISTQEVLIDIGALNELSATAFVPVENLSDFEPGQSFLAIVDDGARQIRADFRVKTIDPRIDAASRTFRMVLTLSNPDGLFLAGSTMLLEIE